jgi:hypothetical protein
MLEQYNTHNNFNNSAMVLGSLWDFQRQTEKRIEKSLKRNFEFIHSFYCQELEITNYGYAPVVYSVFDNLSRAIQKYSDDDRFDKGGFYFFTIFLDRRDKNIFYMHYQVAILFESNCQIEPDLIASCHECKYCKQDKTAVIVKAKKCLKLKTVYEFNGNAPIFQSYFYSFPLFADNKLCPYFVWRRDDGLKWKLEKDKRPKICFFCKCDLDGTPKSDVIIHHKKMIKEGGGHNAENLEYAHRKCHDEYHMNLKRNITEQI